MMGNDRYGDCTFAGGGHAKLVTSYEVNKPEPPLADTVVVNGYLKYTNGQDVGAVESDLLKCWQNTSGGIFGIPGDQILAYAPVDISSAQELQEVTSAYGFVYIGIQVPSPCEQQFRNSQPWALTNTAADNDILGGHCVIIVGYDASYFYVITWGAVQAVEWSWFQKYLDEAWAVITSEVVDAGALGDLRLADLQADINSLS